jgi:hypothetical protein
LSSDKHSYLGNPNLKPIDYSISYTIEQVKEILKCSGDPIYFIENYCNIVSLDKGLILFKLYDCQKEKVETILNNRKVILMEGRQQGKCCEYSTLINVRNKNTGETLTMKIGDFYKWQSLREWVKENKSNLTLDDKSE